MLKHYTKSTMRNREATNGTGLPTEQSLYSECNNQSMGMYATTHAKTKRGIAKMDQVGTIWA